MIDSSSQELTKRRIEEAVEIIQDARHLVAFTGAGISVESGVSPFRGPGGLWNSYDPKYLELSYLTRHPDKCWRILKEIFYEHFAKARPNDAHQVLARLEHRGVLKAVITQNIDNLHQVAGTERVIEFHGNTRDLRCLSCGEITAADPQVLEVLPPTCSCGGLLKPDCIFFGEAIPQKAWLESRREMEAADGVLIIGSTGEVYPAASLPHQAAESGARIIEINPEESNFTQAISDVFIPLPAGAAMNRIEELLGR
ncbi:MAG: NAD-dependent deacylase [Spirochaetaceae bacterium]|nr:MAG: NAD-dependent deacylase [Spirochaetaceae bacterium]